MKIAKNITLLTLKSFLKSFESRSILSTKNWIASTNLKWSKILKSSMRFQKWLQNWRNSAFYSREALLSILVLSLGLIPFPAQPKIEDINLTKNNEKKIANIFRHFTKIAIWKFKSYQNFKNYENFKIVWGHEFFFARVISIVVENDLRRKFYNLTRERYPVHFLHFRKDSCDHSQTLPK